MKSITIIIPYFGTWPFWFDFFLISCARNPSIRWLFFTDCGVPTGAPHNVQFTEMTFAEYKQRARDVLRIEFDPAAPYKLCDLRPAYGLIHREELQGCDYWGFGDIDVIYGNLRAHFNEHRLTHQLISCHGRRISGHLTLIANTELMRTAFYRVPDWQQLMLGTHVALDERAFSRVFLRHRSWPKWLRNWVFGRDPYMRNVDFSETYSTVCASVPWLDGSFNFPTTWYWRDGSLTNDLTGAREFPYLHFVQWKQADWKGRDKLELVTVARDDMDRGFVISARGINALAS